MDYPSPILIEDRSNNNNNNININSPLLGRPGSGSGRGQNGGAAPSPSPVALGGAARFLHRVSSRRLIRESSAVAVRETAAEHLEERQSQWAYSRPIVALDVLWNLTFLLAAAVILALSLREQPSTPLRVWVLGYSLQCCVHIFCVLAEYRRRRSGGGQDQVSEPHHQGAADQPSSSLYSSSSSSSEPDSAAYAVYREGTGEISSIKRLESANTMFSFVWWIIGFYWITTGGEALTHDAPRLYWLCAVFLAFDVFFVVFCIAVACLIGIAVCCCLPCIIGILYTIADQNGASDKEIKALPKYKFHRTRSLSKANAEATGFSGGTMCLDGDVENAGGRFLPAVDAECCICLTAYDDSAELRELPCKHHFHCACIDKWLHLNATCPLCKYNIAKGKEDEIEDI